VPHRHARAQRISTALWYSLRFSQWALECGVGLEGRGPIEAAAKGRQHVIGGYGPQRRRGGIAGSQLMPFPNLGSAARVVEIHRVKCLALDAAH
jgi:hypothetical protein